MSGVIPRITASHFVSLKSTKSSRRVVVDSLFRLFLWMALAIAVGTILTLLVDLVVEGAQRLNWDLVANMPSARPERAGIQSAIFGSLWVVATTAAISIPTGVAAAVYLEEFASKDQWYNRLIELNIQNLASVPSVVYGILGLAFIARGFLGLGFTVITAALILTLVVLPTVVIASREALRAVPDSLRQGSLALGATEWETVSRQVLPAAVPGIATGTILSTSRALGESAPLLLVGALTFVTFNPTGLDSTYTVLPLTIFRFISEARLEFRPLAAAASVVLLVMLLGMNAFAILLRNRYEKKLR
ncbi:MAG TPA: phosphate ABC transporter permease PstA [Acidimicrobiia bacterium]|nr:phosphate ABC transporter permease PstA [Acidimicrobiia bacterium]